MWVLLDLWLTSEEWNWLIDFKTPLQTSYHTAPSNSQCQCQYQFPDMIIFVIFFSSREKSCLFPISMSHFWRRDSLACHRSLCYRCYSVVRHPSNHQNITWLLTIPTNAAAHHCSFIVFSINRILSFFFLMLLAAVQRAKESVAPLRQRLPGVCSNH